MKRRFLSTLMALVLALSLMPTAALAEEGMGGEAVPSILQQETETGEVDALPSARAGETVVVSTADALKSALENADADQVTVVLEDDIVLTQTITMNGGSFILDMDGYAITYGADLSAGTAGLVDLYGSANLTVTGDGEFTFDDSYIADDSKSIGYIFRLADNAQLVIENGTYYAGLTCVQVGGSSGAEIRDGTFSAWATYDDRYWILNKIDNSSTSIEVSGGTFENYDPSNSDTENPTDNFCADGYAAIQDGDNYIVVPIEEAAVAQVNDEYYLTLQDAIDAAASKATVKLRADVTESITIPKGKEIVLDLNGKKLVNSNVPQNNTAADNDRKHTITNNGTLTIIDSAGNGQVDNVSHGRTALYNEVGATATLNGGTYTRSAETGSGADTSGGNSYYTILNHGTMTINDGVTVNQGADGNGKYSSLVENGWQDGKQNETEAASVMTINGGTFSGGLNTIKNDDYGELIINGGELSSYAQACVLNWNTAKITGGTFDGTGSSNGVVLNGYLNDTMDKGELTITGGEFRGKSIVEKMSGSDNSGKIQITDGIFEVDTIATSLDNRTLEISGGNFSKSVPTEYLASSLNAELKRAAGTTPYSYYKSIAAATAAAQPGDTVTELGTATEETHTVTLKYNDGRADGTVKAAADTEITLPTPTRDGYTFRGWSDGSSTYNGGGTYKVSGNVTLTAQWSAKSQGGSSSSGGSTTYSPTLDVSDGGTIKVSPRTPEAGDKVTITPDPDNGYEVGEVTVTDRSGDAVRVTANRDGTYTFTQPRGRVTIEVTFVRAGESAFFDDVPASFWAYDEIAWAYDNGYVNGTSATTFSPNSSITRQQVWMILARLSGADPASMAAAREWAMVNDISDGTNPGNAVTRQQLVALLYRYAQLMGYDNGAREALSSFPDAGTVSGYAQEPMQWSVANGIVAGTSAGTLNPTGTATRAQFAVILYRFWDQVG